MSTLLEENQKYIDANAFAVQNHIVISKMEENYAEGYIDLVPDSLNTYGGVHGGALFTLADVCAAFAARTDGRSYVTQQANSNFLRSASTGRIIAKGNVINRSRNFCLIEVNIYDKDNRLLYNGSFNYYCVDK